MTLRGTALALFGLSATTLAGGNALAQSETAEAKPEICLVKGKDVPKAAITAYQQVNRLAVDGAWRPSAPDAPARLLRRTPVDMGRESHGAALADRVRKVASAGKESLYTSEFKQRSRMKFFQNSQ